MIENKINCAHLPQWFIEQFTHPAISLSILEWYCHVKALFANFSK